MDPVTAVGLVASVVQLIDSTTTALRCLNDIKNAPKERARLAMEITSLLSLLTSLRYRIEECKPNGSWFAAVCFLGVKNGPLDQLASTINDLQIKFGAGGGLLKIKHALLWPFTKKDVEYLFSRVDRIKLLISLAFQQDLS
jgi:hypothetical protein